MAGEINATNAILSNATGEIVGQMEFTLTYNGTPIDISNKSYGDFVTLMDKELASKQLQISGSIVYNDDLQYKAVRADSLTGTQALYILDYSNGESFEALMTPNGLSDALPHGDKITTSITFLSSDEIQNKFTP